LGGIPDNDTHCPKTPGLGTTVYNHRTSCGGISLGNEIIFISQTTDCLMRDYGHTHLQKDIAMMHERTGDLMTDKKPTKEELKKLAKESMGALSWIKLSEPLEVRLKRIKRELSRM
jgi:hypothetical protein